MRYRLLLVSLTAVLILTVLVLQLIGLEWVWIILNGIMQHELRW